MDERCRVIQGYVREYAHPIAVRTGEEVATGEEASHWPGWFFCTDARGVSGWVPVDVLQMRGDGSARLTRDYDAIELTVAQGEEVLATERLRGWGWCRNAHGDEGWVPLAHLEPVRGLR